MNPNVASMMDAVRSYCLLANIDKNAVDFIAAYGSAEPKAKPTAAPADMTLSFAIENGLKQEVPGSPGSYWSRWIPWRS